jgi:hypothetical protein
MSNIDAKYIINLSIYLLIYRILEILFPIVFMENNVLSFGRWKVCRIFVPNKLQIK